MVRRSLVRVAVVLAVVGVHLVAGAAPSAAAETATPAATRAQKRLAKQSVLKTGLKWVETQRDASGAFLNRRGELDASTTAETVGLLIALGNVGIDVEFDEAVAFLQQTDPTAQEGYPQSASIVMALVAAGGDPRNVGGVDLIALLADGWNDATGLYGSLLIESALAILALTVAGESIEEQALATIEAAQLDDGSWNAAGTTEPGSGDALTTAFVVQALVAAGNGDDAMIEDAVGFFRTAQSDSGAFMYAPGYPPDANTTGLVISALIAAGENPKAQKWGEAVSGLLAFQNESGGFRFDDNDATDDLVSTNSALIALAGAYLPVLPATA